MAIEDVLADVLDDYAAASRTTATSLLARSTGVIVDEDGVPHGGRFYDDELRVARAQIRLRDADVLVTFGELLRAELGTAPGALLDETGQPILDESGQPLQEE